MAACYCGTGKEFSQCCEPYLKGDAKAPTAEALMRARYSAFATQNVEFVKKTVLPEKRGEFDDKSTHEWSEKSLWLGFEVKSVTGGTAQDTDGKVEFIATYKVNDAEQKHHELAEFVKKGGRWYFVDGTIITARPFVREEPKVGRNDPCPCGSGKKFKKCCENK
jgi:SEC-C motif-containing protein